MLFNKVRDIVSPYIALRRVIVQKKIDARGWSSSSRTDETLTAATLLAGFVPMMLGFVSGVMLDAKYSIFVSARGDFHKWFVIVSLLLLPVYLLLYGVCLLWVNPIMAKGKVIAFCLLGLVGFLPLTMGGLQAVNAVLDFAPPSECQATVRFWGSGRHAGEVNLQQFRQGLNHRDLEFALPASFDGSPMKVVIYRGFFGWEWGAHLESIHGNGQV